MVVRLSVNATRDEAAESKSTLEQLRVHGYTPVGCGTASRIAADTRRKRTTRPGRSIRLPDERPLRPPRRRLQSRGRSSACGRRVTEEWTGIVAGLELDEKVPTFLVLGCTVRSEIVVRAPGLELVLRQGATNIVLGTTLQRRRRSRPVRMERGRWRLVLREMAGLPQSRRRVEQEDDGPHAFAPSETP
jgi:hypothetical protein